MSRWFLVTIAAASVGVLLITAAAWYSLALPGQSHEGPQPPVTDEERDLALRLRRHVEVIAHEPHNLDQPDALARVADYIVQVLSQYGHRPERQIFEVQGQSVENIAVTVNASGPRPAERTIVVGAHYDSFGQSPGANDNGSGTAAVIELVRLLSDLTTLRTRLILVLFVNEEPPYFQTLDMGSVRFAKLLAARGEPVAAMLSLETIGFYSDRPRSQRYPKPLNLLFPSTASFIAFIAMPGSRGLLHSVVRAFRETTPFPSIGGVGPSLIPGIGWSDHWAFAEVGFPAVMVTDTALFRYPHYHLPTDMPDKIEYEKLARITKGLERVIRALASVER
jgi:hypothetical protein